MGSEDNNIVLEIFPPKKKSCDTCVNEPNCTRFKSFDKYGVVRCNSYNVNYLPYVRDFLSISREHFSRIRSLPSASDENDDGWGDDIAA
jgi:hypothetical protein